MTFIGTVVLVFLLTYFLSKTNCEELILPQASAKIMQNVEESIRLPTNFVPSHYKILLEPRIPEGYTEGEIWIDVTSAETDPTILLDIGDIDIDGNHVKITDKKDGTLVKIASADYAPDNITKQYYEIKISPNPTPGQNYTLHIPFQSRLNDKLQGFYKSSYVDNDTNKRRWMASTQFSPTDARRAFPCFDRPSFKATFEISIIRPSNLKSMSNMPLKNETEKCTSMCSMCKNKDTVIDCFETTPKMSTYLVAFVVSDLEQGFPDALKNQTTAYEISAWARKDYVDQLEFASKTSVDVIKYLEKYFDIPFPLPKIDIVAVPEFGYSAMENWGLIIYRESICLIPPHSTSEKQKHRAATVIAHETAHQWFGNLVTPDFWNDLWLKEGFATYIGYLGVDEVFSDWDMDGRFVVDEVQDAMNIDSNVLSHPISYFVDTEAKIRSLFDPISYSKGASLIRMMHNFLGDDTFKTGLIKYLKKFSYANVKQDDLWDILTEQAYEDGALPNNVTMKEIMDSWTLQTGYPVVNVKRTPSGLHLTQSHFILPSKAAANETSWWIPISVVSEDDPNFKKTMPLTWLSQNEKSKSVDITINKNSWIVVNVNESGFYRVNYEDDNWNMLIEKYPTLPELTRAQLLDDSLYLARGDQLEYNVPLEFIAKLSHDNSPLPWGSAEGQLMYLINSMATEPAYGLFRVFMNAAVRGVYKATSYQDPRETHNKALLRSTIVKISCAVDLPECLSSAQILFRDWMRDETFNQVPPDTKQAVYCTAIRRGGAEEWDFALRMFKESSIATERELLLDGLGCATEPWLLSKYLNMTLVPDSPFSKQDGYRIFASVASNKFGHEIAVSHLLGNFKEIYDYYGEGFGTVRKMIESLPTFMNKESDQTRLEAFAEELLDMGINSAYKAVTKALENVKNNIYWRNNRYSNLEKWLIDFNTKYHLV